IERIAQAILIDRDERASLPPNFAPSPLAEVVLLSDLWSEIADVRQIITQLSGSGAHGHVVKIVDPAEETFPYWGRIEFVEPEDGRRITAGRAENWRAHYTAQIERPCAATPAGEGGVSPFTAPTAPQASFCSPCPPAPAPDRLTNMSSRAPHARRWCRHDRRTAARLR